MKKFLSRLVKIGLILTLLGAVLFVSAFAASGFSFEKMSGIVTTTKTYTESENFTANKLILNFDYADIKLNFDENATEISIQYDEKSSRKGDTLSHVTVSESGEALALTESRNWKENLFLWNFKSHTTIVTIPSDRVIELDIETDTGDVVFTGTGTLNGAEISIDTGDLYATRANLTSIKAVKIETDTGDVNLKNLNASSLGIETDTGDIDLTDITATDSIALSLDTGDLEIKGRLTARYLEVETDTGDVDADDAVIDAEVVSIETDTGDISAKIFGKLTDYTVTAKTRTGDSNITNQAGGARKLTVTASTGDIEIYFTE
jgi:hypothetical protein